MLKFVKISVNDIVLDPENAGTLLRKACLRRIPARPTGLCDCGGLIVIPLEDDIFTGDSRTFHYYFAKFPDLTEDGVAAEIRTRYQADMSCLGSFRRADEIWGLFAREDR